MDCGPSIMLDVQRCEAIDLTVLNTITVPEATAHSVSGYQGTHPSRKLGTTRYRAWLRWKELHLTYTVAQPPSDRDGAIWKREGTRLSFCTCNPTRLPSPASKSCAGRYYHGHERAKLLIKSIARVHRTRALFTECWTYLRDLFELRRLSHQDFPSVRHTSDSSERLIVAVIAPCF